MKRAKLPLISLLIALLFITTLASTKEVTLDRTNLWGRLQYNQKLHENGIGLFSMVGSRYNLALSQKVNDTEVSTETMNAFLQEIWVGPMWGKKLAPNLTFGTNLLYRPQFWFLDEAAGKEQYNRHTIMNNYSLLHTVKPLTIHYRLGFWNLMANDDKELNNELIIRPLVGFSIPLNKKFSFLLQEEIFLNTTAKEGDLDGEKLFNKNLIWTGFTYKPTKKLSISLQYVNMYSTLKESLKINDHYIMIHTTWQQGFHSPKK